MLVPEVAQGAADELAELRAHCETVVRRLTDAAGSADGLVTVVGSAPENGRWGTAAGGSLYGFGVDARAGGAELVLPADLTIGAWLLDRVGFAGERAYVGVHGDVRFDVDTPVLVMGDGSAKRSATAPGHIDGRASTYDKAIAEALATGDARALASLDVRVGEQLWAGGVPALRSIGINVLASDVSVRDACLHYAEAPYGVGYFVAEWHLGNARR